MALVLSRSAAAARESAYFARETAWQIHRLDAAATLLWPGAALLVPLAAVGCSR